MKGRLLFFIACFFYLPSPVITQSQRAFPAPGRKGFFWLGDTGWERLVIGLLPTWGDKVTKSWGVDRIRTGMGFDIR